MDQDDSSRPAMVGRAVMLLYSSLGIGVLRIIMEYQRLAQKTSIGFVLFGAFAVAAVTCFFIYKISNGRNWARVTFIVLFILGVPFSVGPLMDSLAASPFSGVLGIAQALIQFVAIALLIQKSSSNWFRYMKDRSQS